jgi:putative flavoprotein involved in K+ transport
MDNAIFDVLVIGAGHAGLSISYHLKQHNLNHVIFERKRIGDSWSSQRWDTFKMNTANKVNILPGSENIIPDPDGFCSATDFIKFLEGYAKRNALPIREQCDVTKVEKDQDTELFLVSVSKNGVTEKYRTKQIVVASGIQNVKCIPDFAKNISSDIYQLHTSEYKNASCLPQGAVLVVGTAQSGVQVAEDLIDAGKKIYISTSKVARIPRRYRGKDIVDWLNIIGFYDVRTEEISDVETFNFKQPQVSGSGLQGHTVSLQSLAKCGAEILGKLYDAKFNKVFFQSNAIDHVLFADEFSKKVKRMIDNFINKSQVTYSLPELDPADLSIDTPFVSNILSLKLKENNITTVIWATGLFGDFSYLKLPTFNENSTLKHSHGISVVKGVYFLGLPWLRKRKSGIILGIREDSEFLMEQIIANR